MIWDMEYAKEYALLEKCKKIPLLHCILSNSPARKNIHKKTNNK